MSIVASDDWWSLDIDGLLSIFCTGAMPDYTVGGAPWYSHRDSITSCTIADSVTYIGEFTFYGCAMASVTIPSSIASIGAYAFWYCRNLVSVNIPSGITSVEPQTFTGCRRLTSVTIPVSVTRIFVGAFYGCESLTDVYFEGTQTQWNGITRDSGNEALASAVIHCQYGSSGAAEPVITNQPDNTSAFLYVVGDTPNPITITAQSTDGGALSYQWYKMGTAAVALDEESNSCTPDTAEAGTARYYCDVTNTAGQTSAVIRSKSFLVTVLPALSNGQKYVLINDTDFTAFFPPWGYAIEYVMKSGGNEGEMQDGSYREDEIARKAVVTFNVIPLTAAQDGQLTAALYLTDSVKLRYWDRITQSYREIYCKRPALSPAQYRGRGADGNEYWTAGTLTFEEL